MCKILKYTKNSIFLLAITLSLSLIFQTSCTKIEITTERPLKPLMGWASWNNYRININENIIKSQADALSSNGMKEAGYNFINIDDGFYGGRDKEGNILSHPERFPSGMKSLADYIHSKDLKAGIYSDAGINTCASYWDQDTIGSGMGLYGHEDPDLHRYLIEWGYDFFKVDWCGGQWLDLDEETRYTSISQKVRALRPDVIFNICRWQFPGEWAVNVADSWRISGDIGNDFSSIMHIIDQNADLWKYSGPGHVNDMDMLQVGRGMTIDEDKTHFSMWCMLCSPLLAGNDLTKMEDQTLEILTNMDLIAVNQDALVYQARRLIDYGDTEVWAKPLISTMSGQVVVALLNRSDATQRISFGLQEVGLDSTKGYSMQNLWTDEEYPESFKSEQEFNVKPHETIVLKIKGTSLPFNVYQFK